MQIVVSPDIRQDTMDTRGNLIIFLIINILFLCSMFLLASLASYAENGALTGVLTSGANAGSMKYTKYMTWYGSFTSMAISVVCLFCLGQTVLTFICTLGYLANPVYWNYVDALKQNGGVSGAVGRGRGASFDGDNGSFGLASGLDSIWDNLNKLNFNLKRITMCSNEFQGTVDVNDYSTPMDFIVKGGPAFIISVLFLNMGWKGTLQRITAATVDGLTVYAEALPWESLPNLARWKGAQQVGYNFTLNLGDTPEGEVKEEVARRIFNKVMNMSHLTGKEEITLLGTNTEKAVAVIETKFKLPDAIRQEINASRNVTTTTTTTTNSSSTSKTINNNNGTSSTPESSSEQAAVWSKMTFNVVASKSLATLPVNQAIAIKVSDLLGTATPKTSAPGTDTAQLKDMYILVSLVYTNYQKESVFDESNGAMQQVKLNTATNN